MEDAQEMSGQILLTDGQEKAAASNKRMLEWPAGHCSEGPHGKRCKNEEQGMDSPDNASGQPAPAGHPSGAKVPRTKARTLCEHQRVRSLCKDCGGSGLCEHQRQRSRCKDCGGSGICEHQRERNQCKDCGGSGICEHQRVRSRCKDCGGSSLCQHQRRRTTCKDCGGGGLCEHLRERSKCKDCGGSGICEHQRQRSSCKDCGGSSICQHQRQRRTCKDCRKPKDKTEERDKGKGREREKDVEHGGDSAGDQCQLQMADGVEEQVKGTGIDKILTKYTTSHGVNCDKVASGDTVQTLSDSRAAGAGVGDHGRGTEDRVEDKKVRRAVSHDLEEDNGGTNTGSESKRSDSAPHKGWREYIAASGRLYYHHKATKTTQWKKPF